MRAHTGERPHKCLQCPKAFTRPDLLKKHNRVHTGQRFTCLVCGKSFTSKHYLTEHSWTHGTPAGDSPPVEYCCGWCKQTFPTVELFKQHSKVHLQKTQNTLAIQGKPVNVDKAVTNEYNRLSGLKPLCWDLNDDGANVSNMGSPGASTSEGLGNHGNIAPESEVTVIQNYGCSETFDSPNLLEKHASGNEPVTFCDTLFYNCKFCHLTFEDLSLLEGHTWSHLMDDSVQIDIDDNDMMECHLHSCASCSLVFITREQLEEHQCPTFYLPTLHYQP
ncbi:hypothetical protein AAG570_002280 [Ranatra chinensis]|uniref:C2H2-type domain-containing protein n=1 Tax=Ranatra chinensis TaxID=642074 RepID=A0ABD0YPW5_9HEMI